jgi:hypothetical protein
MIQFARVFPAREIVAAPSVREDLFVGWDGKIIRPQGKINLYLESLSFSVWRPRPMRRALIIAIYVYAGLSVVQWGHAMWWLYCPPDGFWCGNVISDPYLLLVNAIGPLAAECAAALTIQCIKARCWPYFTAAALVTFDATSACLVHEGYLLRSDYGMDVLSGIWWLPLR